MTSNGFFFQKWFTAHKKQVGVKTHDSPDSGFAGRSALNKCQYIMLVLLKPCLLILITSLYKFTGAPGTSANAMKSQMDNRRIVETSGLAGTSVPGMYNSSFHSLFQ